MHTTVMPHPDAASPILVRAVYTAAGKLLLLAQMGDRGSKYAMTLAGISVVRDLEFSIR